MDQTPTLDLSRLRQAIRSEYGEVAACPAKGFHVQTGRRLAMAPSRSVIAPTGSGAVPHLP